MAGEVGAFVIGTDAIGGASSAGTAGGALPGSWTTVSAVKPPLSSSVARSGPVTSQVKP